MPRLYTRRPPSVSVLSVSGEPVVDDGFRVFLASASGESCSLLVASCALVASCCVLAASVIIWEACAFFALALVLAASVTWCLSAAAAAAAAGGTGTGTGTAAFPTAAAAPGAAGGRASRAPRGLAQIDISALPKSPYQQPAGGVTCAVCLEDLRGGEMVRSLPECRHLYHVGCIDAWLQMHVTCPLCRSDLSPRSDLLSRRGDAVMADAAVVGSQSQSQQADSWSPQ